MRQMVAELETMYYRLQPGDGTLYYFHISHPRFSGPYAEGFFEDPDTQESSGLIEPDALLDGVGDEFVLVTIVMPHWQGAYYTTSRRCKVLHAEHVAYMASHMDAKGHHYYTIAAVLLAVGVLATDPLNLSGACKAMLRAPDILADLPE